MGNVVHLNPDLMRSPQHVMDARAALMFPELLSATELALAERVANAPHIADSERLQLFGVCVRIGRARFREDRP